MSSEYDFAGSDCDCVFEVILMLDHFYPAPTLEPQRRGRARPQALRLHPRLDPFRLGILARLQHPDTGARLRLGDLPTLPTREQAWARRLHYPQLVMDAFVGRHLLAEAVAEYERSRNPLDVLRAVQVAAEHRLPRPPLLEQAIETLADSALTAVQDGRAVFEANRIKNYRKRQRDLEITLEIEGLTVGGGLTKTAAVKTVARAWQLTERAIWGILRRVLGNESVLGNEKN